VKTVRFSDALANFYQSTRRYITPQALFLVTARRTLNPAYIKVLDNKVRIIFGPKGKEVTGG
jgi:hypothetical protein